MCIVTRIIDLRKKKKKCKGENDVNKTTKCYQIKKFPISLAYILQSVSTLAVRLERLSVAHPRMSLILMECSEITANFRRNS